MTDPEKKPAAPPTLEERVVAIQNDLAAHRQEERNNGARVDALGGRVDSLTGRVHGLEVHVKALTDVVVKNHTEVMGEFQKLRNDRRGE